MQDFTIGFAKDPYSRDGVTLIFGSEHEKHFKAKCVTFIPPSKKFPPQTMIYDIIVHREPTYCTFSYPDISAPYTTLKFNLKEAGKKGWNVTVNLDSKDIHIQESTYQVI